MDAEQSIAEIELLERIFAVPDTRPLSASDLAAANRRHDEQQASSPWFRLWQRYGILPLVVHRCAFELLALRIGSTRCGRAGLAIRRHHNSAGDSNLSAFLDSELQCVIINLLVRSRI
jgi:hypothetical protein